MTTDADAAAPTVWRPDPATVPASRASELIRRCGCDDMPGLRRYAEDHPVEYWQRVADWLDLDWQRAPSTTVTGFDAGPNASWFPDGALNIADNSVDRWVRRGRGGDVALHWELDDATRGSWTFAELATEVDALCQGLAGLGVVPGDRVGMQLPMVRESVVAMLACAKLGAVCVPVFSGFGGAAVATRLAFAEAKVHIVAVSFPRRGRAVSMRSGLAEALVDVPSLAATVTLALDEEPGDAASQRLPNEVSWEDLVAPHRGHPFEAYVCPADHPLMIAFTSGSTGAPKGIVLSHSGFAIKAVSDAAIAFNLGPGTCASWITDPGWIMSPIVVYGALVNGGAVAVFSGTPNWPDARRIWDFADACGVGMLGVSPTLVRLLMSEPDSTPGADSPVELLASSGEPWTPDAYTWLFQDAFAGRVPIINYSGGTEVSGGIVSNTPVEEIHPCGFAGPLPGMGADIVDDEGNSIEHGVGELILRHSSPGMPVTFWADPQRYVETYWSRWDGIWLHGDWAEKDDDGVWFIRGRSDDTLKIAGKRVGPSEVESVVNGLTLIRESAAIGVPHPTKGEALVVFARPAAEADASSTLAGDIADAVGAALGKPLRPAKVHVVSSLPQTRSGKILRRVIRAVYLGEPTGDLTSLDDPGAIAAIEAVR